MTNQSNDSNPGPMVRRINKSDPANLPSRDTSLKSEIGRRLLTELSPDLDVLDVQDAINAIIRSVLADEKFGLTDIEQASLYEKCRHEISGLGPLDALLEDDTISESEIIILAPQHVFIKRQNKIEPIEVPFENEAHAERILDRLTIPYPASAASPVGMYLRDRRHSVTVIHPPLASGPVIIISKLAEEIASNS